MMEAASQVKAVVAHQNSIQHRCLTSHPHSQCAINVDALCHGRATGPLIHIPGA